MAKKITQKTKKIIKENTLLAVAITSVLINLFFIIGVITFSSTSKFDKNIYVEGMMRYCDDYDEVKEEGVSAIVNGQEVPQEVIYDITCKSGEFSVYYDEAVEDYLRDLGY